MKLGDTVVARYCRGKRVYCGKIVGIDKKDKQVAVKCGLLIKLTRLFDLEYDYVVPVEEEEKCTKQPKKNTKKQSKEPKKTLKAKN